MKLLRFVLALGVIGYAGWLAWPFISPFFEGAAPDVAATRAEATLDSGGNITTIALWVGAVALYLIAALMLGSGNTRAAIAYFLGFIADAVLRLALDAREAPVQADIAARSADAMPSAASGGAMTPTWIVLGVLLVVGLLIVFVSRRQRRARMPGQLTL